MPLNAQNTKQSRVEIGIAYGGAGSFFVDYGRPVNKQNGYFIPPFSGGWNYELYQKNFLGTIGNINLAYKFKKNAVGFAYSRQTHHGKFQGNYQYNNFSIIINHIELRHNNDFYEFYYRRSFLPKQQLFVSVGLYVMHSQLQEMSISPQGAFIGERNAQNAGMAEGGASVGLGGVLYSSGKFSVGLQSKLYFTISIGDFETVALTPFVKYDF